MNSPQGPETNTGAVSASISASSRAQALDWSLVLISQGIESVVQRRAEDGAWILEVSPGDLKRATESVLTYQKENAISWKHELKWTGLLFDARSVIWFIAVLLFHFVAIGSKIDFKAAGVVDRAAVLQGEWWRLCTAITLHADVAHLAANVTTGIIFLGLAMGCFGPGAALLLSFAAGALGNVATVLLHDGSFRSLGASGMVMAALGLLTAYSLTFSRHERRATWIGRGVIAGCLLVVLLGLSPRSDVVAHLGGFIAGAVLGMIALRGRAYLIRPSFNMAAGMIFALLVLLSWGLALTR